MAGLRSLIVKIGADTANIEKALAGVGQKSEALNDRLKRLGNTPLAKQAQADLDRLQQRTQALTDQQQKLGERAVFAARGLEQIGGPARLMTRDLDQMARSVRDGIDAFRALGQQVPAELRKAQQAIEAQQRALRGSAGLGGVLGGAKDLLGALGLGVGTVGAAGLGLLVKQTLDAADSLTKLSDRTGIGIVALQRLQAVAEPSGNALEDVASAIGKFQKNLASGDKDATSALQRLGLSIEQIKHLSPDEQFIAIAKAFQTIKDPAQEALIATQLFEKAGIELIPTLKAKVDELADSTVKMSASAARSLDDFGDNLQRFKRSALAIIGELVAAFLDLGKGPAQTTHDLLSQQPRFASGRVGPPPGALFGSAQQSATAATLPFERGPSFGNLAGQSAQFTASIARATAELRAQQAVADHLGLALDDYQQKLIEVNAVIAAAQADTGRLTAAQQVQVLAFERLGLSSEQIGIKLGVSALAVKAYQDQMQALVDRMHASNEATGKFQQELGKNIVGFNAAGEAVVGFRSLLQTGDITILTATKNLDGLTAAAERLKRQIEDLQRRGLFDAAALLQVGANLPFTIPAGVPPQNKAKIDEARNATREWRDELGDVAQALTQLAQVSDGAFGAIAQDIATIVVGLNAVEVGLKKFKDAATAAERVAGLATAAAGFLQVTGSGSTASRAFGGAITGAEIGGTIGAFVGGPAGAAIGAGVGAVAGGAFGFFRGLFNNPEKQINPIREAFVRAAGGLEQLNARAVEAGVSLHALLDAKNPEQYAKAIEDLNRAFSRTDAALTLFDETVKKYNFSLGELGATAATRKLAQSALALFQDFEVLQAGGVSTEAILKKMGTSINTIVRDAQKFHLPLPSFLKPVLEDMIRLGKLTDANGQKITDISQLTFSDSLQTGIKSLADAVLDLVDALRQAFHLPTRRSEASPAPGSGNSDTILNSRLFTGGRILADGQIQHFAQGGRVLPFIPRGSDTVPALLTPGEVVLTARQQADLAGALGGVTNFHFDQRGSFFGSQAGREVARLATPHIIERIAQNKGGANTRMRGALQVTG